MSGRFTIDKTSLYKILKVFGWTMASAVVTLLLSLVDVIDFPTNLIPFIPLVNIILYALKEFIQDNR